MHGKMFAFVKGVACASVLFRLHAANGLEVWAVSVGLLSCLFLCVSPSRAAVFAFGLLWAAFWARDRTSGLCSEFIWFLCQTNPQDEPGFRFFAESWIGSYLYAAQQNLAILCHEWHPLWGPWALGLLGGQIEPENDSLTELYRSLGLLHVLVISGSHFTFLSKILDSAVGFPARLLYAFRCLSFRRWLSLDLALRFATGLTLCFYALVVGFSPPCQRALVIIICQLLVPLFVGRWPRHYIWTAAAALQAGLFPLSFLSVSNALSWSAAAVLEFFPRRAWWPSLPRECAMGLVALAYFGGFSPLGLLINPMLEPIWGPLLLLTVVAIVGVPGTRIPINWILDVLHQFIGEAVSWQESLWGGRSLSWLEPLTTGGRLMMWGLSLFWLSRAFQETRKRPRPIAVRR